MRSKELKNGILKLTEGIFSTVVDLLLWEIVYLGEAATTFSRNTWEPKVKADKLLEKINYETIKRAIENAREKGLIKRTKRKRTWPEITKAGKKRLASIIPQYDEKRIWDSRLYLVTYDIPETRKKDRELLREYLKRIGAGLIQESVWFTPYNPRGIVQEFIKERELAGTVIVSDIGKDGSIGEEDIKDLIIKVYKLDEINKDYQEFLEKFKDSAATFFEISFAYWRILRRDPQLPFELLPSNWQGEKAYQVVLKSQPKLST